jgi:hypothetical protein
MRLPTRAEVYVAGALSMWAASTALELARLHLERAAMIRATRAYTRAMRKVYGDE